MTRDEIVAAARRCIGARFRPQGRDPDFGLDCAGVAAIAFGRSVRGNYPLRGGNVDDIRGTIAATGLRPIAPDEAGAGDLLLLAAGPMQPHLAILTECGFVHADAGLRRVVETPGSPPGVVLGAWTEAG